MKLVVGLGNPGRRYVGSRHNVGFRVIDELRARYALGRPRARFRGELTEASLGGEACVSGVRALLLCPRTYMNRSGASVQLARDFYKLGNDQLLVVCDDINLPVARLRFRARGSSGGQKGMADVIQRLGSDDFARLRIGIGQPREGGDAADYVLSRFFDDESELIEQAIHRAGQAVRDWCCEGTEYCMNQYNAA